MAHRIEVEGRHIDVEVAVEVAVEVVDIVSAVVIFEQVINVLIVGVRPMQLLGMAVEGRCRGEGRYRGGEGGPGVGADFESAGADEGEAVGVREAGHTKVVAGAGVAIVKVTTDAEVVADAREADGASAR
jgi:hypothetical protein